MQARLPDARATVATMLAQFEADTADADYWPILPLYKTNEAAQRDLGPETTKEQHAAIIGLVTFFGEDLNIQASFVEDGPEA